MGSILITVAQLLFTLFMYSMGTIFFGAAMVPGLMLINYVWHATLNVSQPVFVLFIFGCAFAASYFLFGLTLILLVGLFRFILRLRLKEGVYPMYSFEAMKWAFMGSLYLMIHYTFIDFILLTPFSNLLFRLLGAKLGRNVQFNSKFVFDHTLLEIGDNTVIGGGAIINGHIVERGRLVLRKVRIGSNVTVGSHSTIMPGCNIGDRAIIGASTVLQKDTQVGAKEVWVGIPAESLRERVRQRKQERDEKNEKSDENSHE